MIWDQQRELQRQIAAVEVSDKPHLRDTALVFVPLSEDAAGKAQVMKVDVGPPPIREFPVLTAGFTTPDKNEERATTSDGLSIPHRKLILREGYLGEFGRGSSSLLQYDVAKIRIPLEPGMSGGPLIVHRPEPVSKAEPVFVGINNGENELAGEVSGEAKSFVTGAIALWRHDVALPDQTWIPFKEAVRRGIIATSGAWPHHVVERDGQLVVDAGTRPSAVASEVPALQRLKRPSVPRDDALQLVDLPRLRMMGQDGENAACPTVERSVRDR